MEQSDSELREQIDFVVPVLVPEVPPVTVLDFEQPGLC